MRITPEAKQRLEQGFQKRIDEEKRRFASQWQSAIEFGRRSGLGEAVGIFRAEIHPLPISFFLVGVLAPIAAIPVLIFATVKGVPGMSRLLFVSPFLISGWIAVSSWLTLRNRYNRWLFAYAGGFTEFDEGDRPELPTRWDDFTDVVDSWIWEVSEVASNSWSFDGLRLSLRGESPTFFNTAYCNMLDPHQRVNRLPPALLPSAIGSAIPQFPTMMEVFMIHLIPKILDRHCATLKAGGIVERAGIRVTRDGLIFSGETSVTSLAEIGQIDLTPERARIYLTGGGGRSTTKPVVASAGPWILSLLLRELAVPAFFRDPR